MINRNILKEVLSIPSYSGFEDLVSQYIIDFAESNKLEYYKDNKGNVYVTKGNIGDNEYYPCVVAHMDTVHRDQIDLIKNNNRLKIVTKKNEGKTILTAKNPLTDRKTGIGGDDKCGVYLCLQTLLDRECVKAAFFVSEEVGMLGSKEADPEFFKDVAYAIQFDAPTGDWFSVSCNGIRLWNEEFGTVVKPILESKGVTNFSYDPFTDVVQLKKKFDFCCAVLFSGYYRQHSTEEYVIIEDVDKSYDTSVNLINTLGLKKYHMNYEVTDRRFLV
jgi:di/tripeptidase